jgi:hypothetical protein
MEHTQTQRGADLAVTVSSATHQAQLSTESCAAAYLERLEVLGSAISDAIRAISANSHMNLRESISRQEALCDELWAMTGLEAQRAGFSVSALVQEGSAIGARIQATAQSVQRLNLEYAALLRQSGKTIALLASLWRSHSDILSNSVRSDARRQTWSCEA